MVVPMLKIFLLWGRLRVQACMEAIDLASNSLLEAVVYAENVYKYCESHWDSLAKLQK